MDKKVLDDDDKSLKEFGVKQGDQLEIKDLGPQIGTPSCSRESTMDRPDRESWKADSLENCRMFFSLISVIRRTLSDNLSLPMLVLN